MAETADSFLMQLYRRAFASQDPAFVGVSGC